jgi:hypothetical protein
MKVDSGVGKLVFIGGLKEGQTEDLSSGVVKALQLCTQYAEVFGGFSGTVVLDVGLLREHIREVCREFDPQTHVAEAVEEAADFVVPEEVWTRDTERIKAGLSVVECAQEIREHRIGNRFNPERCEKMFSEDIEIERLRALAKEGAVIDVAESFVPSAWPGDLCYLAKHMPSVFEKHAVQLWEKGRVLLFHWDMMEHEGMAIESRHFSDARWTYKKESRLGRFLIDCTFAAVGWALNSEEAKELIRERYGDMTCPTIQQIVLLWFEYIRREKVQWADCRLYKSDIKSAFPQFDLAPQDTPLFFVRVSVRLVMVLTVGLFGWCGFPLVFAVIGRALERWCQAVIRGVMVFYVDDAIGLAIEEHAKGDQEIVEGAIENTCGIGSVAVDKQVLPCLEAEIIGWWVSLTRESLRPSDKGIRKLFWAFLVLADKQQLLLKDYERLASLAERYANGLLCMRPFVRALHNMTACMSRANRFATKKPSSAARFCIEIWRVVAIWLYINPEVLAVPLSSMLPRVGSVQESWIVSDAGPCGLGAAVFVKGELVLYAAYAIPFSQRGSVVAESKFQNFREYLGFLFGLFLLRRVIRNGMTVHVPFWRGDNVAALSWAESNKCNSKGGQMAHLAVTWLSLRLGAQAPEVEHVAGWKMGDIDSLSRGYSHTLDRKMQVEPADLEGFVELMSLCDPTTQLSVGDHHVVFRNIVDLIG